MNDRVTMILAAGLVAVLLAASWAVLLDLTDIESRQPRPPDADPLRTDLAQRPLVRIGVISRFAPNIIYTGYQPIVDYLNRHGTHRYELRLSTSYQDALDRLRRHEVEASFLGAWMFGHVDRDSTLVPLVAPLNAHGESAFQAVLVTRSNSPLRSVAQLRGKRVALPSAQSWSGNWLRTRALPRVGLTEADLDSVHHFDHHQTVVWQVLNGSFQAGVVKEAVASHYQREGLREVARSAPIPGPPLVGHRLCPPAVRDELTRLLLALDRTDPDDREVLDSWTSEFSYGFTTTDREAYTRAFTEEGARP